MGVSQATSQDYYEHVLYHYVNGSSDSALNYYPMALDIYNTTGTSSGSVVYLNGSSVGGNFSDIAFFDNSGNPLNFWLDNHTRNSSYVRAWVNVTSIPAGTANAAIVRIAFGNSTLGALAYNPNINGNRTFDFFDEFLAPSNAMNTTLWSKNSQATVTVSNGAAVITTGTAGSYYGMWSNTVYGIGKTVTFSAKFPKAAGQYGHAGFDNIAKSSANNYAAFWGDHNNQANFSVINYNNDGGNSIVSTTVYDSNYHTYNVHRYNASSVGYQMDNAALFYNTASVPSYDIPAAGSIYGSSSQITLDYIFVRNLTRNAPTNGAYTTTDPGLVTVDFTSNLTTAKTVPATIQFNDTTSGATVTAWNWSFGDGTDNATAQNPVHTYSQEGTYNVTLTVLTAKGNTTVTKTDYITVTTIVNPGFETGSTTGWGEYESYSGNIDVYTTYPHTGTYYCDIDSYPGSAYVSQNVSLQGKQLSLWMRHIVGGGYVQVYLDSNTSNLLINTSLPADGAYHEYITPVINLSGEHTLYVQGVSFNASSAGKIRFGLDDVSVYTPGPADFSSNVTSGIVPFTVQFNYTGTMTNPTSWNWSFGDGSANSTVQNPSHTYESEGIYDVALTVSNDTMTVTKTKVDYIPASYSSTVPMVYFDKRNYPRLGLIDYYTVDEDSGNVTLTLLKSAGYASVSTVKYYTGGGTAITGQDYDYQSGTVTFQPNEYAKTITIPIHHRANYNGPLVFWVNLTDYTNCDRNWQECYFGAMVQINNVDPANFTGNASHMVLNTQGNDLYNYTVKVVLYNTTGINGGNTAYLGSAVKSDWTDLDFNLTQSGVDTGIEMPHWIESYGTNNVTVWTKMPWIYANNTSGFNIRYGDGNAYIPSDGYRTFFFYDDFENFTYTAAAWDRYEHPYPGSTPGDNFPISDGVATFNSNYYGYSEADSPIFNYSIMARLKTTDTSGSAILKWYEGSFCYYDETGKLVIIGSSINQIVADLNAGTFTSYWNGSTRASTSISGWTAGEYNTVELVKTNTQAILTYPGHSYTLNQVPPSLEGIRMMASGTTMYSDWVLIRHRVNNEPADGDWNVTTGLPTANFTANRTTAGIGSSIGFTDGSTGSPTSWAWDFGDGTANSTEQSPAHAYAQAGTYNVTLTATNAGGSATLQRAGYITIVAIPEANFTGAPTSGQAPLTVTFTDASTNATSWSWTFGDGNTSTEQSPAHVYYNPTAFNVTRNVTLNATNAGGSNSTTRIEYITVVPPAPTANAGANVTEGHDPLTVQFVDESTGAISSWLWDFDDGTNSTEASPKHTFPENGGPSNATYHVTLTVGNDGGNTTDSLTITVIPRAPDSQFTANVTSGVAPLTVKFTTTATGASSWAWDFGDGTANSTEQSPAHTYSMPGTYTVILTTANVGGSNTFTRQNYITIGSPGNASFFATPTRVGVGRTVTFTDASSGSPTSWSWNFGDGNTSAQRNPTHVYGTVGTYTVNLTVWYGALPSSFERFEYITVIAWPVARFEAAPTTGNVPLTVYFYDQSLYGPSEWAWDFGDGSPVSHEQNPVHTYTTAGHFPVELDVSNDIGWDSVTYDVYIHPKSYPTYAAPTLRPILPTGDPAVFTPHPITTKYFENLTGFLIQPNMDWIIGNWTNVSGVFVQQYADNVGENTFWLLLFLIPTIILWWRSRSPFLPCVLVIILAPLLWSYIPAGARAPIIGIITVTVVGVAYSFFMSLKR